MELWNGFRDIFGGTHWLRQDCAPPYQLMVTKPSYTAGVNRSKGATAADIRKCLRLRVALFEGLPGPETAGWTGLAV